MISHRGVAALTLAPALSGIARFFYADHRQFGYVEIGNGLVYWYTGESKDQATAEAAPLPAAAMHASVRRLIADFPAPVPQLVDATPAEDVLCTTIYDLAPLPRWHRGNVVLFGDAAQATTPHLGQGAAQAIEDAYVLAAQLSRLPIASAFNAFERISRPKALRIVRESRLLGVLTHVSNPIGRAVRNGLLRATAGLARRQMEQSFRVDALDALDAPSG